MNSYRISGGVFCHLFSLRHRLIYRVEDGVLVLAGLFDIPYLDFAHRRTGRNIASDSVHVQILQALCEVAADGGCPCVNRFFGIAPCIIGFCKVLDEIFYFIGVHDTLFYDFLFMDGVHIYRSEILISPEADACDQHQPQGNHGFLVRADFHSTHLFHFIRFCLFFFFLPFHKNIVLSVLVGFYTSGAD